MSKRFYYDEFLEEIYDEQIDDYPSNQSICGILNQQDQQITELEKQLAEKEKRLKQIDDWKVNYGYTNYDDIYTLEYLQSMAFQSEDDTQIINELLDYFNISDENKILPVIKQQLKSQPAEIVEKIKGEIYTRMIVECKETKYTDINLILNTILKEYRDKL